MGKTENNGEPTLKWQANKNYSKNASINNPGGQERTQNNI